ncbi:MAG: CotH kinase family protein [Cyclobacteriaceae bacterium]|nr:CotH kinase family protein [Cyclobacteriaceae bacterium]
MKYILPIFILIAFSVCSTQAQQDIDHWETIVYDNSVWKYFPGSTDPGATWNTPVYNDSSWPSGQGSIGYGDDDDRTIIAPVLSVFLRKKFTITNRDIIKKAILHVDYDDGFIAYLNGVEIARSYMGSATTVPYNQGSNGLHEALLYQGIPPEGFAVRDDVLQNVLVQGENVLSLQVHNDNINSSDLTAAAFFSVGISDNSSTYGTVPSWFVAPLNFASSNLPIISINTNNQVIQDDVRIIAHMGVVDNGAGSRNSISDPFNNFDGRISIETRGESSQMFPKKSFGMETQDAAGNNLNVALLGMPPENDWVLYAPYTDKTMLRDVLTYKLGNELGHYAPRTRFVELILNGDYQGVYVLIERIKIDKNRVDLATLKPTDVAGDELTGGYILRRDKIDANDYPEWTTVPNPQLPGENLVRMQYFDPKGNELAEAQRVYIRNFFQAFESSLTSGFFSDASRGYRPYIDIPSFVDFMLVNEIGKNIDGYIFSTYMYKDKDSKGGKLHMGPLWDFNLAFGNVDYWANAQFAPGWMWNDQYRMYWFRRMVQDPVFASALKCRWTEIRNSFLTNAYFINAIDSMAGLLNEAQLRNYQRWPILGVYVWPNQYVGQTYQDEINFMKTWIITRLQWMDDNMPGNCELITSIESNRLEDAVRIYPNPSQHTFKITIDPSLGNDIHIAIYDVLGKSIYSIKPEGSEFIWTAQTYTGETISPGLYVVKITSEKAAVQKRIIKN